ncbi:MAG TPA: SARP family transcriptional regulator [Actinobacteria bacterium]|nr:SARP family transcriptional regulator [Actinomycetota bacterium]
MSKAARAVTDGAARLDIDQAETPLRSVGLLGGFRVRVSGSPMLLAGSSQRLVAYLALTEQMLPRPYVAGVFWPDLGEGQALAALRTAVWRLQSGGLLLIESSNQMLGLRQDVRVDYREELLLAKMVLRQPPGSALSGREQGMFLQDLLPGWYEDWVVTEREHYRQLRLHALEALCDHLRGLGRLAEAIDAAYAAVSGDPLRETAHRMLIGLFLAEGNVSEARRHYERLRTLLRLELDVEPSFGLNELTEAAGSGRS